MIAPPSFHIVVRFLETEKSLAGKNLFNLFPEVSNLECDHYKMFIVCKYCLYGIWNCLVCLFGISSLFFADQDRICKEQYI